jgi:hypothetical protein
MGKNLAALCEGTFKFCSSAWVDTASSSSVWLLVGSGPLSGSFPYIDSNLHRRKQIHLTILDSGEPTLLAPFWVG